MADCVFGWWWVGEWLVFLLVEGCEGEKMVTYQKLLSWEVATLILRFLNFYGFLEDRKS